MEKTATNEFIDLMVFRTRIRRDVEEYNQRRLELLQSEMRKRGFSKTQLKDSEEQDKAAEELDFPSKIRVETGAS